MILKLTKGKVELELMQVPELIKESSIHYIFEPNTEHLHPVLLINGLEYKDNHIVVEIPHINSETIELVVNLYDDNYHIIHTYRNKLAYNKYQITGTKPIRPDFERYIHVLENDIRVLKNNILTLEEEIRTLTLSYEARIKELEEKGEII
jgi:hypothetical protein